MRMIILSYLALCGPSVIALLHVMLTLQTVTVDKRRFVWSFGEYRTIISRLRVFMAIYALVISTVGSMPLPPWPTAYLFLLYFCAMVVTVCDCAAYLSGKTGTIDVVRDRFIQMIEMTETPTRKDKDSEFTAILNGYPDGVRLRMYVTLAVFTPLFLVVATHVTSVVLYDVFRLLL